MPYRVREILLISSPYDAFALEQDGRLTARVFEEYADLGLPQQPRSTGATTAARALELLEQRGEHPGLVHILSAMEACPSYQPWHDGESD